MVADELRRQADHFIDLLDLSEYIERAGAPQTATPIGTAVNTETATESSPAPATEGRIRA